jgi:hypothetical protein
MGAAWPRQLYYSDYGGCVYTAATSLWCLVGRRFWLQPGPYAKDCPGIESRWGRDFPHMSWGPPSILYNCYRVFPGVKSGRGVTLTPHPLLAPWTRKSRAIPLLHPWVVRPVQRISACTRVHFTYFLPYSKGQGTAVAQWLRCCASNRKVSGSIPAVSLHFLLT